MGTRGDDASSELRNGWPAADLGRIQEIVPNGAAGARYAEGMVPVWS